MKALPNILTGARLVLSGLVFLALVLAAGGIPGVPPVGAQTTDELVALAFGAFVIAAVTDFFDGWLARKYDAVSLTGAILDPIADKILVCGALIGLIVMGARDVALPAGLILFREFSISAMREVLAPRGIKLPVTFLAKTKTTLQLVAIGAILGLPLLVEVMTFVDDLARLQFIHDVMLGAIGLLWIATAVTIWTGIEYARAARKALAAQS
jgi:CDP-diacylglycerol--glycerol-3-phosphate 3-phosphatidyltransferase